MTAHIWVKSTYGHGETMCSQCGITNREAAVLGQVNECEYPENRSGTAREAPSTTRNAADHGVGAQPAGSFSPMTPPLTDRERRLIEALRPFAWAWTEAIKKSGPGSTLGIIQAIASYYVNAPAFQNAARLIAEIEGEKE
jgi:hypothetical protein